MLVRFMRWDATKLSKIAADTLYASRMKKFAHHLPMKDLRPHRFAVNSQARFSRLWIISCNLSSKLYTTSHFDWNIATLKSQYCRGRTNKLESYLGRYFFSFNGEYKYRPKKNLELRQRRIFEKRILWGKRHDAIERKRISRQFEQLLQ